MMVFKCNSCGEELTEDCLFCNICGAQVTAPIAKSTDFTVLAERAIGGDSAAFQEIYERRFNDLYYIALSMLRNPHDAEDVTQTTFIQAWNHINMLQSPYALKSWLTKILRNSCMDLLRKNKPIFFADEDMPFEETLYEENVEFLPADIMDKKETQRLVRGIVENLPESQRETIILYYFEMMPVVEIADVMGVSEGTVKSRLYHGRLAIKSGVEEQEKQGVKLYSITGVPFIVSILRDAALEVGFAPEIIAGLWGAASTSMSAGIGTATSYAAATTVSGSAFGATTGAATGTAAGAATGKLTALAIIPLVSIPAALVTAAIVFLPNFLQTTDDTPPLDEPPAIYETAPDQSKPPIEKPDPQKQVEDKPLWLEIVQVDSADFPIVSFFANIFDSNNDAVGELTKDLFDVLELDENGNLVPVNIDEFRQILTTDEVSINLVMDKSGSMSSYNRMTQAKNAANYFLSYINEYDNSFVELTFFDSYVYVPHPFTNDFTALSEEINRQVPDGNTALYDAIYSALLKTNEQSGAKCVIVFTDGEENSSSATFGDVVRLAQATGIPVYLVGVGHEVDEAELKQLADQTGGTYFSSQDNDLEESLKKVYTDIYNMRREMYVVRYTSENDNELDTFRDIVFTTKEDVAYSGETVREYIPVSDITQGFSDAYWDKDHILEFSSDRAISNADLNGLSLSELRIARNEIFARHGRMFVDPMLNKWFYSKQWYLEIWPKYSPREFDRIRPYPLSRLETDNVNRILARENHIMQNERIFPNSSSMRLSEYDVSLRVDVLQRGLNEIYTSAGVRNGDKDSLSDIERHNVEMIEYAIAQPRITY